MARYVYNWEIEREARRTGGRILNSADSSAISEGKNTRKIPNGDPRSRHKLGLGLSVLDELGVRSPFQ